MITERNPNPVQFRARLNQYLTGGVCDTFSRIYAELYEDAAVYAQEDDELRAAKEEVEELREALAQAQLDLAEAKAEAGAWTETARMHAKNESYYRDLIVAALDGIPAARQCDDGTVSEDVLCAKLPEIVASMKERPKRKG